MKSRLFRDVFGAVMATLLCNTAAYAQADFHLGYIIQPTGDTVRGELDYNGGSTLEQGWRAGVGMALPLANQHFLSAGLRAARTDFFSNATRVETVVNRYYLLLIYALSLPR